MVTTLSPASMAAVPHGHTTVSYLVGLTASEMRVSLAETSPVMSMSITIIVLISSLSAPAGESFELDISLAHPWRSEACRRAAVENGAAAIISGERKIEKYSSVVRVNGSSSCFVPVVAEHFGRWSKHASDTVKPVYATTLILRPTAQCDRFFLHELFPVQTYLGNTTTCSTRPTTILLCVLL